MGQTYRHIATRASYPFCMRNYITALSVLVLASFAWVACNTSGLSAQPRASFAQLACLDVNGDNRLDAADAADMSKVPDFNADRARDADDAAFLYGADIALDPARPACESKSSKRAPEYAVAHDYFQSSDVSCDEGARPVLLVGIGGGVVNLRQKEDAAGIRDLIDALQKAYADDDRDTIAVLAGPAIVGAANANTGMEQWMAHAVQVYLERYPCLSVVMAGHSHGAVTADVAAARLEEQYPDRIIAVVDLDRIESLYNGDLGARPRSVPVFNVYQTNDGILPGKPFDSPNAENWDASGTPAPEGEGVVIHTTIDNSKPVRDRIVDEVMERS